MKFKNYLLVVDNKEGGVTLFQLGTNKYVKIDDAKDIEKFKKLYNKEEELTIDDPMVKALYDNGYIVDSSYDEYSEMKKIIERELRKTQRNLDITLYVTTCCNFRCIYCPEDKENKRFSGENWNALYKYIEKSLANNLYDNVSISFFGGEPLLEVKAIIDFLMKLKKLSQNYPEVNFEHSITTNGYLLTPEIYDQLVDLNLFYYQITVDGFADTHDKMRPTTNNESSWEKIISNLKHINLAEDDATVTLRTNYNHLNIESLPEFKKWAEETFTNGKFNFLSHPIIKFSERVEHNLLASKTESIYKDIIDEINDFNDERNFYQGNVYFKPLALKCKAINCSNYTIAVDGKISKCENVSPPEDYIFIGYLSADGDFVYYDKALELWSNYEFEDCKTCTYYPICAGTSCPAKKVFYPEDRLDCMLKDSSNFVEKILDYAKKI